MHKFKFLTALMIPIILSFLLIGCASFSENTDTTKLLVTAGTMKMIEKADTPEQRAYRAQVAIDFVDKTRTWLDLEKLTLVQLEEKLKSEIYKQSWEPSDKIIALELIQIVINKLDERVLDGIKLPVPPEEAAYQINTVLDWVEGAALIYQ